MVFKRVIYFVPNALTLASLFLGFSSILFSVQAINDLYLKALSSGATLEAYPERFLALAGFSIFFAGIFDFLDGFTARLFNAASSIGKHLDSLADFVSFGVAPAVLFFTVTLIATEYIPDAGVEYILPKTSFIEWSREKIILMKILAFVLPGCAIFRLARFNLISEHKNYFEGLPTTYSGTVLSIMLTFNFYLTPITGILKDTYLLKYFDWFVWIFRETFSSYIFLAVIYLIFSGLMISKIRFYKINAIFTLLRLNKSTRLLVTLAGLTLLLLSVFLFKYVFIILATGYVLYFIVHVLIRRNREGDLF